LPVDVDVDVVAAGDPFSHHVRGAGNPFQKTFRLHRQPLENIQVVAEDLDPKVRSHPCGKHIDSVYDRLGPAVADADLLQPAVQLGHYVGLGDSLAPLVMRLQNYDALEHGDRRRVGGGFGPAHLAQNVLHFGYALDDLVLDLNEPLCFADRDVGKRYRHVEQGALVQSRHELASQMQEQRDGDGQGQQIKRNC